MSTQPKKRGRPRAYDPRVALERAAAAFWDTGYSATSLDELSAATHMNRPSLYGAFGDKQALYVKALEHYRDSSKHALELALAADRPLPECLRLVYTGALQLYLSGDHGPRGCFLIGTATSEAIANPRIRDVLGDALLQFDAVFERRFQIAKERGELGCEVDPRAHARIASALLHTLALRARAGEKRKTLEQIAASAVDLLAPVRASTAKRKR